MERDISPNMICDAEVTITEWAPPRFYGVVTFTLTDGSTFTTPEMGYADAVALRYDTGLECAR